MPKLTNPQIKAAPASTLNDGGGLMLVKRSQETGKWIWRYQRMGRRRDMGLGPYPQVSLSEARKARDRWAGVLASGLDPADVRRDDRDAERQQIEREDPPFSQLLDMVFEAKKDSLRGDGTRGRWRSPLDTHLVPKIGRIRGSLLTRHNIYDALKPIWKSKHPTALKALRRTRMILKSSKRMGFPTDPDIVDSAEEMLGIYHHKVERIASVDWRNIPDLYQSLPDTTGGRAIAWLLLTLVRMDSGIGARASEVDLETGIWTVPSSRIKGQKGKIEDFRVPLPEPCLIMVQETLDVGQDLIFPGQRSTQKPITNVGVEKVLKTLKAPGTPHGFRTSFRTWVQDTDCCSFELAETILGHVIGGSVERSYARSDMLDRRRIVMNNWASFVLGHSSASIVPLSVHI